MSEKDRSEFFYGNHETQISEGGEAELHSHMSSCSKNPGHKEFIPVDEFSPSHLPEGSQYHSLYELTKSLAYLTVRVDVRLVSDNRPEFWPDSSVHYPFHKKKGSTVLRTGSGRIRFVFKYTDRQDKTCPCIKCRLTDTPSKTWWKVDILTATHVVFDQTEVKHTTCKLFYDNEDSHVLSLAGLDVVRADIERDWCEMTCATCDESLVKELDKAIKAFYGLIKDVHDDFDRRGGSAENLAIIVSHPHGCPKRISIGRCRGKDEENGGNSRYTYTTCTCPGSSGAWIYMLRSNWWYNYTHVHSGVNHIGNFSGTGFDFL
uniref:Uncharacterized protein n=1 Tax=Biomphalaria glabrata TaxID=6526 RepID=A0A2C9M5B0_BIOGL